jgi:PAS domain S-box-containing protein
VEYLSKIFDSPLFDNEIIFLFDNQYNIQYTSPSVIKLLKIIPQDLLNKPFSLIIDPIDHSEIPKLKDLKTSDDFFSCSLQLRGSDGIAIPFSGHFRHINLPDKKDNLILGIFRNQLYPSVNNIHDIVREMINNFDGSFLILNKEAEMIYANYSFLKMYGLTEKEVKSLKYYEIDQSISSKEKWNLLRKELDIEQTKIFETSFLSSSGIRMDVEERWQAFSSNSKIFYVKFMLTIKERKENELKIRRTLERQNMLSQIAYIVNTHENFEYKINEALRIMGNFMHVSRILIFQNIISNKAVNCTFEWHSQEYPSIRLDLQAVPYSLLPTISPDILEKGYRAYDGITNIPEDFIPFFAPLEISSLFIVPLKIEKASYQGFICFIDHQNQHYWQDRDIRFIVTFVDIVNSAFRQKYNMDSLIKSERRFRELAELLPEMVCEAGINGKLTFANKHVQVQFGFTENELSKGIIFFNFFHPSDRQRVLDNFEKLLSGENIDNEEYTIINREKQEVPVLLYMNIIMHDQLPVGLRAVIVDITEQKRYEKHLEHMASIVEDSPFAIIEIDVNGELSFFNEEATSLIKELKNEVENIQEKAKQVFSTKKMLQYSKKINSTEFKYLYHFNSLSNKVTLFILTK